MKDHLLARLGQPGSGQHLALVRIVFALHCVTVFASPALPLLDEVGATPFPGARTLLPAALEGFVTQAALPLRHVGVAAALLALVGLGTRLALPLLLLTFVATQHTWFRGSLFHDDWLYFTFYLLVLCFAPCGDRLSLDALLRRAWARRRGVELPQRPAQAYRWPVEAMIAWFALIYVAAGLAKLFPLRKGVLWLTGASARQFAVEFVLESPLHWLRGETLFDYRLLWPFTLFSIVTVVVELGAGVLLITRRGTVPILVAILGMHAGIYLFGIPGFVQIALASCVLFLPPERFPDLRRR